MRKPSREPFSTCGEALMFSWPPAITIDGVAALDGLGRQVGGAQAAAAHLVQGEGRDHVGQAALMTAWRAGFWPTPAVSTWPMMTSLTRPDRCRSSSAGA
jgi:hypothetical protein